MVEDIIKWTELNKLFDPLFKERRFDIKMVDKQTQHTTLCHHKKVEALRLMIAPKTNEKGFASSLILNTDTAQLMKQKLTDTLLNKDKDVKQFKGTLGLKKDIDDNIIFDKSKRNK